MASDARHAATPASPVPPLRLIFHLVSCGSSTRKFRSQLQSLGAQSSKPPRGALFDVNTTHLITPSYTRSFPLVCALAAAIPIVSPSYITSCVSSGKLLAVTDQFLWCSPSLPPPTSDARLLPCAPSIWRHRLSTFGTLPLHALRIIIVGELRNSSAAAAAIGTVSSAMATALVTAAGGRALRISAALSGVDAAEPVSTAAFALVPAIRPGACARALAEKGLVCFGAALLVDLFARVCIDPKEYLAFPELHSQLVASPLTELAVRNERVLPLVKTTMKEQSQPPPQTIRLAAQPRDLRNTNELSHSSQVPSVKLTLRLHKRSSPEKRTREPAKRRRTFPMIGGTVARQHTREIMLVQESSLCELAQSEHPLGETCEASTARNAPLRRTAAVNGLASKSSRITPDCDANVHAGLASLESPQQQSMITPINSLATCHMNSMNEERRRTSEKATFPSQACPVQVLPDPTVDHTNPRISMSSLQKPCEDYARAVECRMPSDPEESQGVFGLQSVFSLRAAALGDSADEDDDLTDTTQEPPHIESAPIASGKKASTVARSIVKSGPDNLASVCDGKETTDTSLEARQSQKTTDDPRDASPATAELSDSDPTAGDEGILETRPRGSRSTPVQNDNQAPDHTDARSAAKPSRKSPRGLGDLVTSTPVSSQRQTKRFRRIIQESPPSDEDSSMDDEDCLRADRVDLKKTVNRPGSKEWNSLGSLSKKHLSSPECGIVDLTKADGSSDAELNMADIRLSTPPRMGQLRETAAAGGHGLRRRVQLRTPSSMRRSVCTKKDDNSESILLFSRSSRYPEDKTSNSSSRPSSLSALHVVTSAEISAEEDFVDESLNFLLENMGGKLKTDELEALFAQPSEQEKPKTRLKGRRDTRRPISGYDSSPPLDEESPSFEEDPGIADFAPEDNDITNDTCSNAADEHNEAMRGEKDENRVAPWQPPDSISKQHDRQRTPDLPDVPKNMSGFPSLVAKRFFVLHSNSEDLCNSATGCVDDDTLLEESIDYKDWMYGAESIQLSANDHTRLLQLSHVASLSIGYCLKNINDANILKHFHSPTDLRPERVRIALGVCARLVNISLSEPMMSHFLRLLLQIRRDQLVKGIDSLGHLLSSIRSKTRSRHQHLQFLWVAYLDACRRMDTVDAKPTFWRLFNSTWCNLENINFLSEEPAENKHEVSYDFVDEKIHKLIDAVISTSCLFAFRMSFETEMTAENQVVPRNFLASNWEIFRNVLHSMSSRQYTSVSEHRNILSSYLRRLCVEIVDKMWAVEEDLVISALDSVRSLCEKYRLGCACRSIPLFLTQFGSIADLRLRRSSLSQLIATECDCALFLAWVWVAQDRNPSSKLSTKIVRHNAAFSKLKWCTSEPVSALSHHLGLTLSVSESIVAGNPNKEDLLRAMLFSKAPNILKATKDPLSFDPSAYRCWLAVLQTVKLRCRALLGAGLGIHVYSNYIYTNITIILQCLEKSDTYFVHDIKKREAWRVQQRVFVDILVKTLETFSEVVGYLSELINNETYKNQAAVSSLLVSLSKLMGYLGRFSAGLVVQIRNRNSGAASAGRQVVLSAAIVFVQKSLDLCRAHSHERIRGRETVPSPEFFSYSSQSPDGVLEFATSVKKSMLSALVSISQCTVFDSDRKADLDLRIIAARVLAQTLGLCTVGRQVDVSPEFSEQLMHVIYDAKMTVLPSTLHGMKSSQSSFLYRPELSIQAEFWVAFLDSTWSISVLRIDQSLEEMAFAMWLILLVVRETTGCSSRSSTCLLALSCSLQSAAAECPRLGKWFCMTKFAERMGKSASSTRHILSKSQSPLSLDDRLEALTDGFCAILDSWVSQKVLSLVAAIRNIVKFEGTGLSSISIINPTRADGRQTSFSKGILNSGEAILGNAYVMCILFVVHTSLSVSPSSRGTRLSKDALLCRQYLADTQDLLIKVRNLLRTERSSTFCSELNHLQALVIRGLATIGNNSQDVETRICYIRFVHACANFPSVFGLFCWNDEHCIPAFLRRRPFYEKTMPSNPLQMTQWRRTEAAAREWRLLAFHTLIRDPVSRKPMSSQEFRNALRYIVELLDTRLCQNIRRTGLWGDLFSCLLYIKERRRNSCLSERVDTELLFSQISDKLVSQLTPEESASLGDI